MIGFIGLGRMGFSMVERLLENGIQVVAYNRSPEKVRKIAERGATPAYDIDELLSLLPERKILWLMLPAGKITDEMILYLLKFLKKGDIIIDGANAYFGFAEEHAEWCREKGVIFFDCGVSGGVHGLKNGYTLMVGGHEEEFHLIEPYCKNLAPEGGYGLFGPNGAGHYVKSVHNIIEYVYLQGLAEGIELLNGFKHPIDLKKATEVWRPASVINSWLLDLTAKALSRSDFEKIGTRIGSVTIDELKATKEAVKGFTPAFDEAVKVRQMEGNNFLLGKRIIAAVRNEFGGHKIEK
ncbi:MAG: NADP-dependent phosphogluconate dehydrogenase [Candidatus Cloacimonetes bacterium]|jgi:6-phosphogluconate dehydrogenase|nr:NADP-dependent phosphogluconate dehydrogenase [Candidatus Cloacimonadota bacterium]